MMVLVLYTFVMVFIINLTVNGQFPTDNFLFGTTTKNIVWFQNGTTAWAEQNIQPSTFGLIFNHTFLGVHGTAYFHSRNFLVFSNTDPKSIFISNVNKDEHVFAYVGTSSSVGHLAVDWLSGNVYWCDASFGWIGMLPLPETTDHDTFDNTFKVVVDKYLDIPAGIAVAPSDEWIFWTDIGRQPKIERSKLDGTNRNVLVLHGLMKPVSITIDYTSTTLDLYWTDPVRGTIESCDFNGTNRKVFRTDVNRKYYGIEILKGFVFVSEQTENKIYVFSKTNGQQLSDAYSPKELDVSSIAIYTDENQYINNDTCTSMGCEHICLTTKNGAVCICQDGYELESSGKQCTAESKVLERSIVFVNNSKICALPITYINIASHTTIAPDCGIGGTSTGTITHLVINVENDELYFTIDRVIYRQKMYQTASTLYTAANQVTGLTFDWTSTEIYWTVSQSNIVHSATLPSDTSALISSIASSITSLKKPTYISINPIESIMFAITYDNVKQIQLAYLNNSSPVTLENTRLKDPKWLTYNRPKDRLYWTDIDKLGSITSSGQNVHIQDISDVSRLHGIAVYKDYLMLLQSTTDGTRMYIDETDTNEEPYSFPLDDFTNPNIFVIYDKNIQPRRNVPCVKDNGGCQQICVVNGYVAKCECYFGYRLQTDEKSCKADTIATDYFLTIDQLNNRLFKVVNSTEIASVDTGAINPLSVAVDYKRNTIVWIDQAGNSIKSINNDGTSETTLTTENSLLTSLDVDQSTSNIYYTTQDSVKVFSPKDSTKRSLITGLSQPDDIKLHPQTGKMIWTERNNDQPTIKQAFMDGSNIALVVKYTANRIKSPSSLAIDKEDNRLIWSDSELDKIESVSLVNTGESQILISSTREFPVAVDVDDQYVYYIGNGQRTAKRIRKEDGTSASVIFTSVLFGRLTSLVKVTSSMISEHALCKDQNGQCSRLCLPSGANQRSCNCRDGVNLKEDGRTCVGDVQCPVTYGRVSVDNRCTRYAGVTCDFVCTSGYLKSATISDVTCLPHGAWDALSDSLCIRILCPANFTNGQVSSGCNRYVGSTCGVRCDDGFNVHISSLLCQDSGQWNTDVSHVCTVGTVSPSDGNSSETLTTGMIVSISVGGIVLLVIVVSVVVGCLLQRMREESKQSREHELSVIYRINKHNGDNSCYIVTRDKHDNEEEEVYDEIVEDEKYCRKKTEVAKALSKSSSTHRYSKWPHDQDEPPPDYLLVDGATGGHNPYMNQKCKDNYHSRCVSDDPYLEPGDNLDQSIENNGYMIMAPQSSVQGRNGPDYNQHM